MAMLRNALFSNSTLEVLRLVNIGLASEGAVAVAEVLPENRALRVVDLAENPIDIAGVLALSVSMRHNKSLCSLPLTVETPSGFPTAETSPTAVVTPGPATAPVGGPDTSALTSTSPSLPSAYTAADSAHSATPDTAPASAPLLPADEMGHIQQAMRDLAAQCEANQRASQWMPRILMALTRLAGHIPAVAISFKGNAPHASLGSTNSASSVDVPMVRLGGGGGGGAGASTGGIPKRQRWAQGAHACTRCSHPFGDLCEDGLCQQAGALSAGDSTSPAPGTIGSDSLLQSMSAAVGLNGGNSSASTVSGALQALVLGAGAAPAQAGGATRPPDLAALEEQVDLAQLRAAALQRTIDDYLATRTFPTATTAGVAAPSTGSAPSAAQLQAPEDTAALFHSEVRPKALARRAAVRAVPLTGSAFTADAAM